VIEVILSMRCLYNVKALLPLAVWIAGASYFSPSVLTDGRRQR